MADGVEQTRGCYDTGDFPDVVPAPHEADASHGRAAAEGERGDAEMARPRANFEMEMRDSLPGDRAVIGVEQEGVFTWIASRRHVTEQARDEFVEQLSEIVEKGLWTQNWTGL